MEGWSKAATQWDYRTIIGQCPLCLKTMVGPYFLLQYVYSIMLTVYLLHWQWTVATIHEHSRLLNYVSRVIVRSLLFVFKGISDIPLRDKSHQGCRAHISGLVVDGFSQVTFINISFMIIHIHVHYLWETIGSIIFL
jgi:hypothetical protein